jgi:hypothetical protein
MKLLQVPGLLIEDVPGIDPACARLPYWCQAVEDYAATLAPACAWGTSSFIRASWQNP